jgi:predicted RNase H-like HicB family nuclease
MDYTSLIYKDTNGNYTGIIPDVNYVSSYGSTFKQCVKMLTEALELMLEDVKPTVLHSVEYYTKDVLKEMDIPTNAIPQLISYAPNKTEQITITMKRKSKRIIDAYAKTHQISRSAFLEQSALQVAIAN